jgi:6-phosphogluconolactonase
MKLKIVFILLIFSVLSCKNTVPTKTKYDFFVGSYTKKEGHVDGKGEGVYHIQMDENLSELNRSVIPDVVNPSFITLDDSKKYLFVTEELNPEGIISSFDLESKPIKKLSQVSAHGGAPCYVSYKNGFCFVANYVGGNVGMYKINTNGTIAEAPSLLAFSGKGTTARQEAPHPHAARLSEDASILLVPDLGTDFLNVIAVDFKEGKLGENKPIKINAAGAGPRHIVTNGKRIYLANELNSSLCFIDENQNQVESFSTLSPDYQGVNLVADIQMTPNKQFVYVSNRGENSLAAFKIKTDGRMEKVGVFPCKGLVPRNFNITPDGKYLFCANQNSDNIVIFLIENDGRLTYKKEILAKTPTCIVFKDLL